MDKKTLASELVKLAKDVVSGAYRLDSEGKEKPRRFLYRRPYYMISDGVHGLRDAAKKTGDEDIMQAVEDLDGELTILHRKLSSKYIWD